MMVSSIKVKNMEEELIPTNEGIAMKAVMLTMSKKDLEHFIMWKGILHTEVKWEEDFLMEEALYLWGEPRSRPSGKMESMNMDYQDRQNDHF